MLFKNRLESMLCRIMPGIFLVTVIRVAALALGLRIRYHNQFRNKLVLRRISIYFCLFLFLYWPGKNAASCNLPSQEPSLATPNELVIRHHSDQPS